MIFLYESQIPQLAAQIQTFPAQKSAFARLKPPFLAQIRQNSVSAVVTTAVSTNPLHGFRKFTSLARCWNGASPTPKGGLSTTKYITRTLLRTRALF